MELQIEDTAQRQEEAAEAAAPFHHRYLPLRALNEGAFGRVILAMRIAEEVHPLQEQAAAQEQNQIELDKVFKLGEKVAIKIFTHPRLPAIERNTNNEGQVLEYN